MTVSHYNGRRAAGAGPSGKNAVLIAAAAAVVVVVLLLLVSLAGGKKAIGGQAKEPNLVVAKQSALDAATKFELLFQTFDVKYPKTGGDRLMALAAGEYQPILQEEINQISSASGAAAFDAARREGLPYVVNATPISYVIERLEAGRASIVIWSSTLAGIKSKAEPRIGFVRSRVALADVGGKWLVTSHEAMKPIVPYISTADGATREADYYRRQKGAVFYE